VNNIELKNRTISFLEQKYKDTKTFPREYTAKEVADATGGYAGNIGKIAKEVIKELNCHGYSIVYESQKSPKRFVLKKMEETHSDSN